MKLGKYKSKRNIKTSKEPAAKIRKKKDSVLHFVVQEHHARRLHYDLRLEVNGVLKSWAVPKGPSLDPQEKRLAIMVEDHPYEYKDFEGIIPEGYGAGSVLIWDEGIYNVDGLSSEESQKLIREGLKKGHIHFSLEGEKLKGEFSLVRLKKKENEWLLIKKKDSFANTSKTVLYKKPKKDPMPHHVKPMLATLIEKPFDDKNWIFELKLDGFRALAEINHSKIELYSRSFQSFNQKFPSIIKDLKAFKIHAIFDGEIVVLDKKGKSHFQLLQNYDPSNENVLFYYVFDLLYLDGRDLRSLPLIERKQLLKPLLDLATSSHIKYCDHIEEKGKKIFNACIKRGLEGIIGKEKNSAYFSGKRSSQWVKIKNLSTQEAIICGFTEPKGSRKDIGALILGIYRNKTLQFIGHVGGGFSVKKLAEIKKLLTPLIQTKSPFKIPPKTNTKVTWVKPHYVCEVSFTEWTHDNTLRHPIFIGLREDKEMKEIVEEKPKKID